MKLTTLAREKNLRYNIDDGASCLENITMKKSYVVGIDYSLKSPSFVSFVGNKIYIGCRTNKKIPKNIGNIVFYTDFDVDMKVSEKNKGMIYDMNVIFFQDYLSFVSHNSGVSKYHFYMLVEGHSFWMARRSASFADLAENVGVLKHYLTRKGYEYDVVSPTKIKKYVCGDGGASKFAMIDMLEKDTGIDFYEIFGKERGKKRIPKPIDDIADAYAITKYGYSVLEEINASKED